MTPSDFIGPAFGLIGTAFGGYALLTSSSRHDATTLRQTEISTDLSSEQQEDVRRTAFNASVDARIKLLLDGLTADVGRASTENATLREQVRALQIAMEDAKTASATARIVADEAKREAERAHLERVTIAARVTQLESDNAAALATASHLGVVVTWLRSRVAQLEEALRAKSIPIPPPESPEPGP